MIPPHENTADAASTEALPPLPALAADADLPPNVARVLAATRFRIALEPHDHDAAWSEAQRISRTRVCGIKTAEEAYLRILTGRSLGWGMMTSLRNVFIIEGSPCISSKGKVGLLKSRRNLVEYFQLVTSTPERAVYRAKRKGEAEVVLEYTMEQARKAGVTRRPPWERYPAEMLRARCSGQLCDIVAPDLTNGMPTVEEVEDELAMREPAPAERPRLAKAKLPLPAPPPANGTTYAPFPAELPPDSAERDHVAEAERLKERIRDVATRRLPSEKEDLLGALATWCKEVGDPLAGEVRKEWAEYFGKKSRGPEEDSR